jgi:hypothetical protein
MRHAKTAPLKLADGLDHDSIEIAARPRGPAQER